MLFRSMHVDTTAGKTVWRLRVSNDWVVTASGMSYYSKILTVATLGLSVDTFAGTTVWRLIVAIVWVITASGMSYCSNI